MDKPFNDLATLFHQLGLNTDTKAIDHFLKHHSLKHHEKLENATFWNSAQRAFFVEEKQNDANWCEVIDELDARLRH